MLFFSICDKTGNTAEPNLEARFPTIIIDWYLLTLDKISSVDSNKVLLIWSNDGLILKGIVISILLSKSELMRNDSPKKDNLNLLFPIL